MSGLDILGDPLLPRRRQHHILDLIGNGSIVQSPDVGATAFKGLRVPRGSRAGTLEGSQAGADGRQDRGVRQNGGYVLVQRRLRILTSDQILFFLDSTHPLLVSAINFFLKEKCSL